MKDLAKVIALDEEKCVNCHRCISVCPVKFCNDGSGDHVAVNSNLCIGCGACIEACRHGARKGVDDFQAFMEGQKAKEPVIAVVAPGVVSSFPDSYLHLNAWLKSVGVDAVLDVSFGAELTVYSYLEYMQAGGVSTVIAQPCPSIVTFVEIYQPELIPFLAPVDSPMGHTVKMLRTFFPEYSKHRVMALSPCYSKKREFEATGLVDYNVTFSSLKTYIKDRNVDLLDFNPIPYDGPMAERGVSFSAPGGLLETVSRDLPGIGTRARRIEGPQIYKYLKGLGPAVAQDRAPLLIDCLNCEMGCSGGPGTDMFDKHLDDVDYPIRERSQRHQEEYSKKGKASGSSARKAIREIIQQYWRPGLYGRVYEDRSSTLFIQYPSEQELNKIYLAMHKFEPKDHYHCAACGYNNCEHMAVAIHNKINKKEHCHHYYFIMNS